MSSLLYLQASHFCRLAAEENEEENEDDKELYLPPNKSQKQQAIDDKINWIVDISPKEFLLLTVHPTEYPTMDNIEPQPLELYNSPEYQADMRVHPMLKIEKSNGKVIAHEGRHRAAAVMKKDGRWFRVGIKFVEDYAGSRNYRPENMPKVWHAQFTGYQVSVDSLIASGKMRIVNQHVQKEYYWNKKP